jgi:hypothetical protein
MKTWVVAVVLEVVVEYYLLVEIERSAVFVLTTVMMMIQEVYVLVF